MKKQIDVVKKVFKSCPKKEEDALIDVKSGGDPENNKLMYNSDSCAPIDVCVRPCKKKKSSNNGKL